MLPQFIFSSLVLLAFTNGFCGDPASCTSIKDGDFSDATVWSCSSVPGKSTDVTVSHVVNLDVVFVSGAGVGAVQGTWVIDLGKSLISTTSDIQFATGSVFTANGDFQANNIEFNNNSDVTFAGTSDVIIHGDMFNRNNSTEIVVHSSNFEVKNNLTNGVNSKIEGIGCIVVGGVITNSATGILFECTGIGCDACNAVLPIELLNFTGKSVAEGVQLNWTTGSEIDNDQFIIEKSSDGIQFTEIYRVNGSGQSTDPIDYSYLDKVKTHTSISYYRIIDVDFNGVLTYHQIVSVKLEGVDSDIIIHVNPISIKNNSSASCTYNIINLSGRVLSKGILTSEEMYVFDAESYSSQIVLITVLDNLRGKQVSRKVLVD